MASIDPTSYKPPVTAGQPTEAPKRDLGSDDFLSLLMVQLGNQDPLNPMETDRFMDQITAMNSLQQQMNTNDLLGQLVFATGSLNNQAAVGLVGQEVIAKGDTFPHVAGASEALRFDLEGEAATVTITVKDASGKVVRVIEQTELEAGEHTVTWDGRHNDGTIQPDGQYTFLVEAKTADNASVVSSTYIRGVIDELRFDDGTPVLMVGDQEVALPDILRVLGSNSSSALVSALGISPAAAAIAAYTTPLP